MVAVAIVGRVSITSDFKQVERSKNNFPPGLRTNKARRIRRLQNLCVVERMKGQTRLQEVA
jgi:hypothetical protein